MSLFFGYFCLDFLFFSFPIQIAHTRPPRPQHSPILLTNRFPLNLDKTEPIITIVTILYVHQFKSPFIITIFVERFKYCLEAALHLTELPLTQNPHPLDTATKKWKHTHTPPPRQGDEGTTKLGNYHPAGKPLTKTHVQTPWKTKHPLRRINNRLWSPPLHQRQHHSLTRLHL